MVRRAGRTAFLGVYLVVQRELRILVKVRIYLKVVGLDVFSVQKVQDGLEGLLSAAHLLRGKVVSLLGFGCGRILGLLEPA